MVGGGQAGLAIGYHLHHQGLRFVILEAAGEIGRSWRARWDSLTLFSPAQHDSLPGMAFPAPADSYPGKDVVADYLSTYATTFGLPVRLNSRVTGLRSTDGLFELTTSDTTIRTRQVVVATGAFQTGRTCLHFWQLHEVEGWQARLDGLGVQNAGIVDAH